MADIAQTNAQVIAQITALIQKWNEREAQIKDWLGGAADGGPNNDGRFPLSPYNGTASLIPSPAALADLVAGPAAQAENSAELAGDHAGGAEASKEAAEAARDVADAHRASAASARDLSLSYQNQTEWYWSQAMNYHGQIVGYRDTVLTKHGEVLSAHAETLTARDDTLVAKAATLAARDQTLAYVAQINPALLATKAELANELAALVGSSQATLNTLQEIGAALGNDPNFATTITTQLAGKAPATHTHITSQITGLDTALAGKAALSHTHGISDIIGLQTALDGKQGNLGFVPVQQSGGAGQGTNKVYIGWAGSRLKVQVDATDLGNVVFDAQLTSGLATKSDTSHTHSYLGNLTNGWMTSSEGRNRFYFSVNARTFFGSGDGYEWRSAADAGLMWLNNSGDLEVKSALYVGNGVNSSSIYMRDGDNGERLLHCNSDRIGFLNQAGGWGAWCDDGGNWQAAGSLLHGNGKRAAEETSGNRPGVTKLYRKDDDSNFNVQTWWTGSYWKLDGYNGDTWHASVLVARADTAGYADTAGRAYPRRNDGADLNFNWSGQGGQPPWLWGGNDGVNMYVYNPSNFSVNYAASAGLADNAIGYNQQWYQETWVANTSYQNTYGRPIMVSVEHDTNTSRFQVSHNGSTWVTLGSGSNWGRTQITVPAGHYWRIFGSSTIAWAGTLR